MDQEREDYADPWLPWLRALGLALLWLVHAIGCLRGLDPDRELRP